MHDLNVLVAGEKRFSPVSGVTPPAVPPPLTRAALRQAIEGWTDLKPAQRRALVTVVNHATHIHHRWKGAVGRV